MSNKSRVYVRWVRFWMLFSVCISAFFYASFDSCAEEIVFDSKSVNINSQYYTSLVGGSKFFDFVDSSFNDDTYYLFDVGFDINLHFSDPVFYIRNFLLRYNNNILFYLSSVSGTNSSTFDISANNTFVFKGSDLKNNRFFYDFRILNDVSEAVDFVLSVDYVINSFRPLTGAESETYLSGYDSGYSEGYSEGNQAGWDAGHQSGYNYGYDYGYNLGVIDGVNSVDTDSYYQDGFQDGAASVDTDSYYQDGFQDGAASVDTDSYYQDGFQDGVDSIDTDSFYEAGYAAGNSFGYSSGYTAGYDAAYELAYEEGYNQAVENLTQSNVLENEPVTVTKQINIANSSLDIEDVNTTLPVNYDYEYDFDYVLSTAYSDHNLNFHYYESLGDIDTVGDLNFTSTDYYYDLKTNDYMYGLGYYVAGEQKLFTASPDAYAYKVKIKQTKTDYSRSDIWKAWNIVGTHSEVLSGSASLGSRFYSGSQLEHTFFIHTDHVPLDIYTGVLFYFFDSDETSASYSLNATFTVEYTAYTRTEYNQIVDSIKKMDDSLGDIDQSLGDINSNITEQGDQMMNGFDTADADSMNDSFSASLTKYQTAEDSLFSAAQSGLDGFTFVDFSSYPVLVTSMSFVTALMTSVYAAMGGETGPVGIVLSVLFSVMLVSMAIGLYRFYQSKGKGGGD